MAGKLSLVTAAALEGGTVEPATGEGSKARVHAVTWDGAHRTGVGDDGGGDVWGRLVISSEQGGGPPPGPRRGMVTAILRRGDLPKPLPPRRVLFLP